MDIGAHCPIAENGLTGNITMARSRDSGETTSARSNRVVTMAGEITTMGAITTADEITTMGEATTAGGVTVSGTTTVDRITVDATTMRGTVTTLGEAITPVTMMGVNANTKPPLSIVGRNNDHWESATSSYYELVLE